jgi:alanine racemase
MVRPGYLLYGLSPEPRARVSLEVRPVMSFHCRLMQVRHVAKGRWISYARSIRTARDSRVGVLPVGYGHGYPWSLSNAGEVLVRGKRAKILGRVTMDLTMVDITDNPEAAVGDEVTLFGTQNGETITAEEIAERAGTLSYEVLCSIGKRVVRVYRRGGAVVRTTTLVGDRVTVVRRSGAESVTYRRRTARDGSGEGG